MDGTKLTGLWKGKDKNGKTYLSGSLNASARLVVLPNDYKQKDTDPDFFAYLCPAKEKPAATPPAAAEDLRGPGYPPFRGVHGTRAKSGPWTVSPRSDNVYYVTNVRNVRNVYV